MIVYGVACNFCGALIKWINKEENIIDRGYSKECEHLNKDSQIQFCKHCATEIDNQIFRMRMTVNGKGRK